MFFMRYRQSACLLWVTFLGRADSTLRDQGRLDSFGVRGGLDPLYGWGVPEGIEDECQRIEAKGVPLASVLREATDAFNATFSSGASKVQEVVEFFSAQQHRQFLATHCPQAVTLALLLNADRVGVDSASQALRDFFASQPPPPPPHRPPPDWKPWERSLELAQQRSGIVLLPADGGTFQIENVSPGDWLVYPKRRCVGRRDLGNLQAEPLQSCLARCQANPLCRSATFWNFQPGGFGFEQRCFLSSSCTADKATAEEADGAVLFARKRARTTEEESILNQVVTLSAPWSPRCGHRMVKTAQADGTTNLWILGGAGVHSHFNMSEKSSKTNTTNITDVIEAYLSRHVELNGELPPLRSLPYGRLGDVWRSEDLGVTWTQVGMEAPWGRRSFFGAVSLDKGLGILVFGGVMGLHEDRKYVNDVWWGGISGQDLHWQQLMNASWEPRAAFQALLFEQAILMLGGRLAEGSVVSDVWAASVDWPAGHSTPVVSWKMVTTSAEWPPRSDSAAVVFASQIFLMGGRGRHGVALSDVWSSDDRGHSWKPRVSAAPWGARVGLSAVVSDGSLVVMGGYSYPDGNNGTLNRSKAIPALWTSTNGWRWFPASNTLLLWAPRGFHSAVAVEDGSGAIYLAGGVSGEGYYDNSVHKILPLRPVGRSMADEEDSFDSASSLAEPPIKNVLDYIPSSVTESSSSELLVLTLVVASVPVVLVLLWRGYGPRLAEEKKEPLDPRLLRMLGLAAIFGSVCLLFVGYAIVAVVTLRGELDALRSESRRCHMDTETVQDLGKALGLEEKAQRGEHLETLLRLAAGEPIGYGSYGGYGGYGSYDRYGGYGTDKASGGHYGSSYDRYGPYGGYGDRYGAYGSHDRYGDAAYGAYGGYDDYDDGFFGGRGFRRDFGEPEKPRDPLAMLPTTKSLMCRSPRCDRNATRCALEAGRSLTTPHGCCSDYMLLMLNDVTEWLAKAKIPYFVAYGTLLGAVRENDVLPWTQDLDIVVDRSHWPQLQRGLLNAEFFGGRRYQFGVDQWEERVSRVCADFEGFATSSLGAAEADGVSRGVEFHLDVYAADWWQITELHIVDCVEPLGTAFVQIRGQNFSSPARPQACLEKFYGNEWRMPKHALSGVN